MSPHRVLLLSLSVVSAIGIVAMAFVSVSNQVSARSEDMRVVDQQAATEQVERNAQLIVRAAGMNAESVLTDAGPMPCGPDGDVEHRPDGSYSPYRIALSGRVEDVSSDQLEPAIARAREGLQQAGWTIGRFIPAANGRGSTELTGTVPADGSTFTIEALHDLNRIVVSVMSPCYRQPG